LIAVFIPLLFMTGAGRPQFREFALTLTIAVVASAIHFADSDADDVRDACCGKVGNLAADSRPGALAQRPSNGLCRENCDAYHRSLLWGGRQRAR